MTKTLCLNHLTMKPYICIYISIVGLVPTLHRYTEHFYLHNRNRVGATLTARFRGFGAPSWPP